MAPTSLDDWSVAVRSSWGALSSGLIDDCRCYLERLAMAPAAEGWLASLHRNRPPARELYRDPDHGFVLLAHSETQGLYRPPHDHGRSWVMYAVLQGEVEMGTYARLPGPDGGHQLVRRDSAVVTAGQVRVYLPGDIHDTHCLAGPALLLRFTERDLQIEKQERRMSRYAQHDGVWMAAASPWRRNTLPRGRPCR